MTAKRLYRAFAELSPPLMADAALRLQISFRISPPGIQPIKPNERLAGPALPVRHSGSADVFLDAIQGAATRSKNKIPQSGKAEQD
jgi:4-hydroxy-4-methyl-2-oxoglutarate aldolase